MNYKKSSNFSYHTSRLIDSNRNITCYLLVINYNLLLIIQIFFNVCHYFEPHCFLQTPTSVMYAHSRTGSSPAMIQGSPPNSSPSNQSTGSAKATRTHTYPKLPDKYKIRNDQQSPADEEVIYFWRFSSRTKNFIYSLIRTKVWNYFFRIDDAFTNT